MKYKKLSVVIPVYNVQKYLHKCVDSILNQSIKNYEVILVDDGSSDQSPDICDVYAENNENVISLHKKNGGLSDARNFGVQHATADYIVFVDSDDFVDHNYLESLWNLHIKYVTDVLIQLVKRERKTGELLNEIKNSSEIVVDSQKAIELMCYGKEVAIFAYAKLYPKSYLLQTPYPIGKLHEDIFTTYKLFAQCKKIAIGVESPYHYVVRKGSILNSKFNLHHMDSLTGAEEIIGFVKDYHPEIEEAAYIRLAIEANALLHRALSSNYYLSVRENILYELNGKWKIILKSRELPLIIKSQLLLCRFSATVYKKVYIVAKNKRKL